MGIEIVIHSVWSLIRGHSYGIRVTLFDPELDLPGKRVYYLAKVPHVNE